MKKTFQVLSSNQLYSTTDCRHSSFNTYTVNDAVECSDGRALEVFQATEWFCSRDHCRIRHSIISITLTCTSLFWKRELSPTIDNERICLHCSFLQCCEHGIRKVTYHLDNQEIQIQLFHIHYLWRAVRQSRSTRRVFASLCTAVLFVISPKHYEYFTTYNACNQSTMNQLQRQEERERKKKQHRKKREEEELWFWPQRGTLVKVLYL